MPKLFTESILEDASIALLAVLGYCVNHGSEVAAS